MNFDFDIRPFEHKCFVSDEEWQMILESGAYRKIGEKYFTIYKNHILTFIIRENGMIELLQRRRKPAVNYELPVLTADMNFAQRRAVYMEEICLSRGREIDMKNFLIYGT